MINGRYLKYVILWFYSVYRNDWMDKEKFCIKMYLNVWLIIKFSNLVNVDIIYGVKYVCIK